MLKWRYGYRKPRLLKQIIMRATRFIQLTRMRILRQWNSVWIRNPKKYVTQKLNDKIRKMYK
ncbi:hypothetical protein C7J99_23570 [Brevibacillus brevis]|nr:hypothetical protein C7J99_23570 [Brevibacillus brevis]